MLDTAVIVIGGDPVPPAALTDLPERRWVIAADSGLDHARNIGLPVDVLVGDLDSVTEESRAAHTGAVDQHSPEKDATDLELAMSMAVGMPNIGRLIVLGGQGGRLDHLLANAAVIASDRFAGHDVEWIAGLTRVHVVRDHCQLHGVPDDLVSLVPIGGDVTGVTTSGLKWQLTDATIPAGSAIGVSNVLLRPVASVTLKSGRLLAIQPHPN